MSRSHICRDSTIVVVELVMHLSSYNWLFIFRSVLNTKVDQGVFLLLFIMSCLFVFFVVCHYHTPRFLYVHNL